MDFYKLSTTRTLSTNSITINNDILKIEIADDTINNIGRTNCSGTFNLAELVEKFSQDHGCIAIFPKAMHMTDHTDMIAMETTQLSLIEKGGGDPGVFQQGPRGGHPDHAQDPSGRQGYLWGLHQGRGCHQGGPGAGCGPSIRASAPMPL